MIDAYIEKTVLFLGFITDTQGFLRLNLEEISKETTLDQTSVAMSTQFLAQFWNFLTLLSPILIHVGQLLSHYLTQTAELSCNFYVA